MHIVIVGCGRMGALISNDLSRQGHSIIIIDKSEDSFDMLASDFAGFQIIGDATQVEVLRQSKIDKSDLLLVLTDDDSVNLTVSQVGKNYFNVPNVISRVVDPERESLFQQLGIQTICPAKISTDSFINAVEKIEKTPVKG